MVKLQKYIYYFKSFFCPIQYAKLIVSVIKSTPKENIFLSK